MQCVGPHVHSKCAYCCVRIIACMPLYMFHVAYLHVCVYVLPRAYHHITIALRSPPHPDARDLSPSTIAPPVVWLIRLRTLLLHCWAADASQADLWAVREMIDDTLCTFHPFHGEASKALLALNDSLRFPALSLIAEVRVCNTCMVVCMPIAAHWRSQCWNGVYQRIMRHWH
jgi:hypothetical protein